MNQSLRKTYTAGLRLAKDAYSLKRETNMADELYDNTAKTFAAAKAMIAHILLMDAYTKVKTRKSFDARDVDATYAFLKNEDWPFYSSGALVRAYRVYCKDNGLCEFREEAK